MGISEVSIGNKRRVLVFFTFIVPIEIAILLLFCYQNILVAIVVMASPALLIIILKRPEIGLWLMTIISFTIFGEWAFPKALSVVTGLTLVAFFAKVLSRDEKLIGSNQFICLATFGAIALISFYTSRDLGMWSKGMYEIFTIFIVFILIVNLVKTNKALWTFIYIIVFSITAGAIYGLYLFKSMGFLSVLTSTGQLVRAGSVIVDANLWSVSLITAFPLCIALLLREKRLIPKVLLCATSAILIISIFATFSRGGMIAFVIVAFIIIFRLIERKLLAAFILLLFVIVGYFVLPPFVVLRIKSLMFLFQGKSFIDYSLLGRIYIMKGSLMMFLDHPILGVGLSNVISNSGAYFPFGLRKVAHCMYLEIAAGTGLLGLVPFLGILFYSFRDFFYSYRAFDKNSKKSLANLSFFAGLSLLGVLITALFLSIQFNRCVWFLVSISVAINVLATERKVKE